ncbi:MAG: PAS domain S-box protein [Rhodocyclales bacterium]|nr:PAS domain S-box protein [Rhodocyclales bacterium]
MTLTNDEARTQLLREHQLIFDRTQIGILVLRDRVIQRCNPRFEEMLGYGPGELVGKSTRIFYFSDETWQETGRQVYSAVAEAGSFTGEDIYRRRDGTRVWVHVTGVFINPGHPEEGFLGLFDDVTEKRQAADALKALLREHQLVVERARMGIVVLRDRIVQRCNPRFEEMLGYGPGELIGKSTRVYYPVSDEEWNALGCRAYAAIAETGSFTGESRYKRRDGSLIWVRLTGSLINQVNPDEGYVWLYEDITARRATEEALLQSNREQQLIFDNAMIGIAYHRNRIIMRCNPRFEEILGYGAGELVGKSTRVYYASDKDWDEMGYRIFEADVYRQTFEDEISFCRRDGATIWVHVIGRKLDVPDRQTWIWAYEDITRRHQAEEALRQSYGEMEQRVAERTAEVSQQLHFMEQLVEAIPGPVFYKDRQGRYLGFNQRYLDFIGKPRSELIGATVYDIAPRDLADRYQAADEELFNNPGSQVYETQVQPASGERRDVLFHKATFMDSDGRVGGIIGIMFDITERKRMEARMQQAATVFDSSAEGITITAPDGSIIAVNRAFTEITGYSEQEVLGRNPRILQSDRQDKNFYREMWDTLGHGGRWQGELWNRRKDGSLFPEWLTISAVRNAAGSVLHYVGVFADITEIKRVNELLNHQAHHDHLTGLPNRLLLEDRLRGALLRAQRDQTQVAVLFVDLDRFKNINDSLGHHVGDRVLREVAKRFCFLTRESDTVARMGGDEFLIIMEGIHDSGVASRIADKIIDDLRANPVTLEQEQEFFVCASIGISLFPQDGADSVTLIKHADAAMYRAKERGRNTYEFFSDDLTQFSLDRFKMETGLRRAIERDELRVYLQPQFSLKTGELLGAEALVRWQHPQQGLMAPERFIQLAEESGLIVALGEWVQRAACGHWAEWTLAGLNPGVLSINVSGVEFRRGQIEDTVRKVLDATRLPPQLLELEITEGAIMSHAENSIRVLHGLRAMGIGLAIDDFGTGYSSLAHLKRLPLNKLKIDQSFVLGLPGDAEDCAIVRAVIALGHSLQLKVIAEGVETEQQREFLTREACDEMQGYLRGNPMPADEFKRHFLKS